MRDCCRIVCSHDFRPCASGRVASRLQHPRFGLLRDCSIRALDRLTIAASALRDAGPPRSLTPPHIPVRRLPASVKSLPAIFRMKARSREQSTARIARSVAVRYSSGTSKPIAVAFGWDLCCRLRHEVIHVLPTRLTRVRDTLVRASRERGADCGAPTWPGSPGAIPAMSVGVVQGCTQRR